MVIRSAQPTGHIVPSPHAAAASDTPPAERVAFRGAAAGPGALSLDCCFTQWPVPPCLAASRTAWDRRLGAISSKARRSAPDSAGLMAGGPGRLNAGSLTGCPAAASCVALAVEGSQPDNLRLKYRPMPF
jgi:hypothetical protein